MPSRLAFTGTLLACLSVLVGSVHAQTTLTGGRKLAFKVNASAYFGWFVPSHFDAAQEVRSLRGTLDGEVQRVETPRLSIAGSCAGAWRCAK